MYNFLLICSCPLSAKLMYILFFELLYFLCVEESRIVSNPIQKGKRRFEFLNLVIIFFAGGGGDGRE